MVFFRWDIGDIPKCSKEYRNKNNTWKTFTLLWLLVCWKICLLVLVGVGDCYCDLWVHFSMKNTTASCPCTECQYPALRIFKAARRFENHSGNKHHFHTTYSQSLRTDSGSCTSFYRHVHIMYMIQIKGTSWVMLKSSTPPNGQKASKSRQSMVPHSAMLQAGNVWNFVYSYWELSWFRWCQCWIQVRHQLIWRICHFCKDFISLIRVCINVCINHYHITSIGAKFLPSTEAQANKHCKSILTSRLPTSSNTRNIWGTKKHILLSIVLVV